MYYLRLKKFGRKDRYWTYLHNRQGIVPQDEAATIALPPVLFLTYAHHPFLPPPRPRMDGARAFISRLCRRSRRLYGLCPTLCRYLI